MNSENEIDLTIVRFLPVYLTFGIDIRTNDEASHDLKEVLNKE